MKLWVCSFEFILPVTGADVLEDKVIFRVMNVQMEVALAWERRARVNVWKEILQTYLQLRSV